MNKNTDKTFLDSLIDPTSQLFPFSTFARSLTRAIGIQPTFDNFGDGKTLNGTDQDDTIIIHQNLTGGTPTRSSLNPTRIDLMGGDDSISVDGKIIVKNNQYISIDGDTGNKTITVDGIEGKNIPLIPNNYHTVPAIDINLRNGIENTFHVKNDIAVNAVSQTQTYSNLFANFLSIQITGKGDITDTHNSLIIDGGISSDTADYIIYLAASKNEFTVGKDVVQTGKNIPQSGLIDGHIELGGYHNTINIGGDIKVSHYASSTIVSADYFDKGDIESDDDFINDEITTASFNAGDVIVTDSGCVRFTSFADRSHFTLGNLSAADNDSRIKIDLDSSGLHAATSDIVINGNIEAFDNSEINIEAGGALSLEVTGIVSSKIQTFSDDPYSIVHIHSFNDNDNLKFDGGFSIFYGDVSIYTGEGDDNIFVGSDITIQGNNDGQVCDATFVLGGGDDTFTLNGNILNIDGHFFVAMLKGNDGISITGDITTVMQNSDEIESSFDLDEGDDSFSLNGNLNASNANNVINAGSGNDVISIKGNVSADGNGRNEINGEEGDDIIVLNGHINAGALEIDGGDGHDTLVLSAANNNEFVSDYKDWLNNLSSTNALANSNIETIRLDVNGLQTSNLGWFTDIINKANANGANIAIEDKDGHAVSDINTYLAQGNDTYNPINDVLDQYASTAANAAQPKAFAEHMANSPTDAFTAPHFDNNFLHEMEQQAQVHAAAVA